jgi:hypothetical protein
MEITVILWAIISGIISGAMAAGIGYIKGTKLEKFNKMKLFITLFVGAVVGGFAGYQGWEYQTAYEYFTTIGAVYIIEFIGKAIYRRLMPDDKKKMKKPKTKTLHNKPLIEEE